MKFRRHSCLVIRLGSHRKVARTCSVGEALHIEIPFPKATNDSAVYMKISDVYAIVCYINAGETSSLNQPCDIVAIDKAMGLR